MIRPSLHPDPGTGRHWRLSLEVAGVVLSCDVAEREEPAVALAEASRVADALELVADGPDAWRAT
jgi:hypothetical protein